MASSDKSELHDWVDAETRPIDIVASWESLCDTYRALEFTDDISDAARVEEFKWIVAEMNKHLTRARTKLLSCADPDATREVLQKMMFPSGKTSIVGRRDLAYHKLRQRWIMQMLNKLEVIEARLGEADGEYE